MLQKVRFVLVAAGFALAALSSPSLAVGAKDDAVPKLVPLDQKVIDRLIAAQPDIATLQAKAQAGDPDRSDPKVQPKLEDAAKKHGFTTFADYQAAADTVGVILAGFDSETKTYVGPAILIKRQMDMVKADASLPAKDKTQTLEEMKEALANAGGEKPSPETVELVRRNYDKLAEGFQSGGE